MLIGFGYTGDPFSDKAYTGTEANTSTGQGLRHGNTNDMVENGFELVRHPLALFGLG
jgi:hypothetical protein